MLVALGAGLLPGVTRVAHQSRARAPLAVAVAAVTRRRSIMRRLRLAAVVIALLLVAGSVSYSCGRTYTLSTRRTHRSIRSTSRSITPAPGQTPCIRSVIARLRFV